MAAVVAEAPWMSDTAKREEYEKVQVAKDVAGFIRGGLAIETIDDEEVRLSFAACTCPRKTKPDDIQGHLAFMEDSGGDASGQ